MMISLFMRFQEPACRSFVFGEDDLAVFHRVDNMGRNGFHGRFVQYSWNEVYKRLRHASLLSGYGNARIFALNKLMVAAMTA